MRLGVYIICELSTTVHKDGPTPPHGLKDPGILADTAPNSSLRLASINHGNTFAPISQPILQGHTNGGGKNTSRFWTR